MENKNKFKPDIATKENKSFGGIILPQHTTYDGGALPQEIVEKFYSLSSELADEDVSNVQPLNFDCLVEIVTGEQVTKSGIAIGDAHQRRNYGTIIRVDAALAEAQHLPSTLRALKAGDKVLFQHHQILTLPNPGRLESKYALIPLAMIRAIL